MLLFSLRAACRGLHSPQDCPFPEGGAFASVLQRRVVRERNLDPGCPKTVGGVLVRGHAGLGNNKLSLSGS